MGVFNLGRVTIQPRVRSYAFERPEVAHGKQWVLKVKVPAAAPAMPLDMAGAARRLRNRMPRSRAPALPPLPPAALRRDHMRLV